MTLNPARSALIGLMLAIAAPVEAQEVVAPPTPNADRLAEEVRTLARDPRNLNALLAAGELSARLNDPAAAAGFFARAQAIDANNPRLQAGQAMAMVRMERPGEALRLFAEAERRGLAMAPYASDRGLAYDLIGAQPHAQREHRIAMRGNPDDETVRRYALSLGISGQAAEAERVLEPLLRRSDRAAWRARAFILAMNGDASGADRIAASMMGGFGTALSPFFRRLPSLSAADKAFAVHFGEMRRTPARIADAQAAPPLPALAAEPRVAVASVPVAPPDPRRDPGTQRARDQRDRDARETAARVDAERRRQQLARERAEELAARRAAEATRLAETRAAQQRETQRIADARAQEEREALAARQRESDRIAAEQQAAQAAEAQRIAAEAQRAEAQRIADATARAAPPVSAPPVASATDPAGAPPPPAPGFSGETAAATRAEPEPVPARSIGGEDNVIARIISGITIPASELGVAPMPGREPGESASSSASPPAPVETVRAEPARQPPATVAAKPDPVAARPKGTEAKAPPPKAPPKPDPAKAEPARHWAQVAGGADVKALPREWARLVDKAPAEFRGKQAWTTPLRFTNRLLVGPFKTPAEAQTFVNAVAGKGISAFAWTSEAGQKIEKLPVK